MIGRHIFCTADSRCNRQYNRVILLFLLLVVLAMVLLPSSPCVTLGAERSEDAIPTAEWIEAAKRGKLEVVKRLLSNHPELINARDKKERAALVWAVFNDHTQLVQFLLSKGADPNGGRDLYAPGTPLLYSRPHDSESVRIMEILLSAGATVSARTGDCRTPLHLAVQTDGARARPKRAVDVLLKNGAYIEARDRTGRTALHYAVKERRLDLVKFLIKRGADPDAPGYCGRRPLHVALLHLRKPWPIVHQLLNGGASVAIQDGRDDRIPLHIAAEKGHDTAVGLLLEGASFMDEPHLTLEELFDGKSPLVKFPEKDTTPYYYARLATLRRQITEKDPSGKTALELAKGSKHWKAFRLLKDVKDKLREIDENRNLRVPVRRRPDPPVGQPDQGHSEEEENLPVDQWLGAAELGKLETMKRLLAQYPQLLNTGKGAKGTHEVKLTALHQACAEKHVDVAQFLLRKGADPDGGRGPYETGTPLLYSRPYDLESVQIMEILLSAGATVSARTEDCRTPLHLAVQTDGARARPKRAIDVLLKNGGYIEARDRTGRTALHYAVKERRLDLVKFLIKRGADPDAPGYCGRRPLHVALLHVPEPPQMVYHLLKGGASVAIQEGRDGRMPIHIAAAKGYDRVVGMLLEAYSFNEPGKNDNETDEEDEIASGFLHRKPPHLRFPKKGGENSGGRLRLVRRQITEKERSGKTAVDLARDSKNSKTIRLFSEVKEKLKERREGMRFMIPRRSGRGVAADIFTAISMNDLNRIKELVRRMPQEPYRHPYLGTPLEWAARFGHTDVALFLIQHYSDVQKSDHWRGEPLAAAAARGHIEMMRLLLKRGFDPNGTAEGTRPLCEAVEHGQREAVEFLLRHGARLALRDSAGNTALHYACRRGEQKLAELLISKGIDVHSSNAQQFRPLHVAAEWERANIVELLLRAGADPKAKTADGKRPLDLTDDPEVRKLLKEKTNKD